MSGMRVNQELVRLLLNPDARWLGGSGLNVPLNDPHLILTF